MTATRAKIEADPAPIDVPPAVLALCDEFLRRDGLWRAMPRPAPATPTAEAIATYDHIWVAFHYCGAPMVAIQDAVRAITMPYHSDRSDPASPMVDRFAWDHAGRRFIYEWRGNRLLIRPVFDARA